MADNLDPEVLAQFQEAMRQATEAAKAMPAAMSSMVDTINKAQSSLKNNTKATQDQTDAVEDNTDAVEENEAMLKAQAEAAKKEKEARNLQTAAILQARTSLISFGDALLSGTRGFEKYNKSINSAGDAALDFGKSLGGVGTILGYIVKGATMVGSAMMKQADDTLKATDELSKMGTAGAFSAEQVRKMGTGLGLASDQLDKLVKPVKSLGSSLISLGGNAADGAAKFAELAKVTSEQRQAYQRLGISQEEQIQNTADYINLQTQQGRQLTEQMKRDGTLRNAAREYTDNLLELAALTGKDIEAVKKKNELAMGEIETAIQNNLLDQEINRLRKLDTNESRARANQLEQERKARDKLLQRVENEVGDPALRKGLAKFLATGAITEEVAALKRIGVPVEAFAAKIKQGVDVSDQFMDSLSKNGDAMVRNVGTAAMFDENTRKAFGVSSEFMNYLAKARDRDEKSMSDLTKARIADTKAGKGAAGEDPAQKARNALTEAEIRAKVALDDLVASANPLLNNFSDMSLTVKALIVAAGLATAALGALAAAATVNAAKGVLNTIKGAGGVGGKILDAATSTGTGLAKATKIGGAAAAVGMGAYDMYQGRKQADEDLAAGKITAAEAKEKKQDVTYGAAGGTAGALVGGALGSALGPVGTIVGGMVGQAVGEKLGKWAASWDDKTDPKTTKVKDQVQIQEEKFALNREKYALEQQATDQTVSEAERKLAQIKLRTIAKEEALLLNQEAINEYKNAKTDEEREAAKGKSDRARATLAQLKTEEATYQLEKETDNEKRKTLEAQLLQARKDFAQVEIHRATQILKSNANEEEKKAAQARLDNAKKQLEQETITIKKSEEIRKAEEELKKAVNDEQKKDAEAKIKLLKEGLEKELEAINKKYNTTEAKPVDASQGGQSGTGSLFNNGLLEFDGGRKDGGSIAQGKFAVVGEEGPELVTGPAGVLNAEQIRKAVEMGGVPYGLNLSGDGIGYASNSPFAKVMLAYETKARNDKAFQKRIQDALKNSSGNLDPYETLAFALETVEGQRWAAENDFGIDISESMNKGPNKEIRSYFNQILKQMDKEAFAGFFADGGIIPKGKFGVVGEKGPEFVSGPAGVTNQDQFAETTEDFIDTFFETDKAVKEFDKELSGFVKDDPAGKMTKQLNLVTTALEDLNELINPNVPSGLELPGQTKVPSAGKIASAVMSQLSGILGGGSMPTAGGSTSAAMPAGSGDMPTAKSKPKGILGAIASALGFSSDSSDTGGKDSGDVIPKSSGNIDMLDMKKSAGANVPVGNMSEDDIKKMIIRHEGVRYRPYKDSLGLWTVGIGHLIGDGKSLPASWNREFSKEEVLGLFEKDYEHHRKAAERIPGFDKMNTVGQGALTDLTFNMGPAWINGWPNTKRKLEQGDAAGAAENLEDSKWYGQVGNRAPTIVNMVRQGMKAAQGGIFDGPSTGYPVEMHGKEMVTRLDPNSLLEKLAKTPASQIASEMNQPAKVDMIDRSQEGMKELAAINVQMMEMLSEKLDGMINRLDTSNETQDKLLKFSQA